MNYEPLLSGESMISRSLEMTATSSPRRGSRSTMTRPTPAETVHKCNTNFGNINHVKNIEQIHLKKASLCLMLLFSMLLVFKNVSVHYEKYLSPIVFLLTHSWLIAWDGTSYSFLFFGLGIPKRNSAIQGKISNSAIFPNFSTQI